MNTRSKNGGLDAFRLIAALLVIAIHTSPLTSVSADADFFLTRILARVAVPFFFMVTGQFVVSEFFIDRAHAGRRLLDYLKKTGALYGVAIALYVPVGIYAGHYKNPGVGDVLRLLFFDGTFYHLWYFPACMLGTVIVFALGRMLRLPGVTAVSALLYVVGLCGDSYYGLAAQAPVLKGFYDGIFSFCGYTRNGLFFAPLFLVLGVWMRLWTGKLPTAVTAVAAVLSFAGMSAEGFALRAGNFQRHDSMYVCLIPVMIFGYRLLLDWQAAVSKRVRKMSAWVYILHPLFIVLVRGFAGAVKLEKLLVENSLLHYGAVALGSFAAAWLLVCIRPKRAGSTAQKSRAWIEIDRRALASNVSFLQSCLPKNCELMPAVKANAYGHGALFVARELNRLGVSAFCVASAPEGAALRKGGVRGEILVLGYTHPAQLGLLKRYRLTQSVVDTAYAKTLLEYGRRLHVHIGVDSGMHRLGIPARDVETVAALMEDKRLQVDGIYTHLATSDGESSAERIYVKKQVNAFEGLLAALEKRGLALPDIHMQASYGVLNYPQLAGDFARVGIALYGVLSTGADTDAWSDVLRPVLSLKARVASVRTLGAGESAGYGIGFTAAHDMAVATIAVGYADGVPRELSAGGGEVLIRGQRAPIIGRICMDQLLADVSAIPQAKQGDTAVLIGASGTETISAADVAERCGTITNEILSRLGGRIERVAVP